MTIDDFPLIEKVALSLIQSVGALNRYETQAAWIARIEDLMLDEDVDDLLALERWLGTLSEEQRYLLADGEEFELEHLRELSPLDKYDLPIALFFNEVWEMTQEDA